MRKMLVATILLALIITGWSIEDVAIGAICDGMIKNIEKLKDADKDELEELIEKTKTDWEKGEKVLEILTPHEDTDDINVDWAVYQSRIKEENYTSAVHVLNEIGQHFKEIKEKIKVNIQNIF